MQFDYKQAADTLATALEQTEAGSYRRLRIAYLAREESFIILVIPVWENQPVVAGFCLGLLLCEFVGNFRRTCCTNFLM